MPPSLLSASPFPPPVSSRRSSLAGRLPRYYHPHRCCVGLNQIKYSFRTHSTFRRPIRFHLRCRTYFRTTGGSWQLEWSTVDWKLEKDGHNTLGPRCALSRPVPYARTTVNLRADQDEQSTHMGEISGSSTQTVLDGPVPHRTENFTLTLYQKNKNFFFFLKKKVSHPTSAGEGIANYCISESDAFY